MKKFSILLLRRFSFTKAVVSLILILSVSSAIAQNGTIKGSIIDASSKEPLIGAAAMIKSLMNGSASDFDGNYEITNVKPGKYTIVSSYISYKPLTIENVVVEAGKETIINIELESANITLQEVVLVGKLNRESENVLLLEQKQSLLATQAVGAKEMSRKGISNAEAAVVQVSGISKQDGVKNVVVRGLGDRYNFTTLNGFPIPSEDPESKNISLDFFSSDIIKNIEVNKVFSADNYADAGGAVINVSSKELVGDKELSVDMSAGLNSETPGSDFAKMDGVNYFGVANANEPGSAFRQSYSYNNSLNLTSVSLPINYGYGFSLGKKIKTGQKNDPLSFYMVSNYNTSSKYTHETSAEIINDGTISEQLEGHQSSQNINQLMLLNVSYLPAKKHEINYNFLVIHNNNQYVGRYTGLLEANDSYDGHVVRQQTNDNLLITNQLFGKFMLSDKLKLNTGIAFNHVAGTEPDRRVNRLKKVGEDQYLPFISEGSFVRNFSELIENDYNVKLALDYLLPLKFKNDISAFHFGYNARLVTDNFNASEYSYNSHLPNSQSLLNLNLDSWYNQDNFANDKFNAASLRSSVYGVNKMINSPFASVDYQFNSDFTLNIGVSVDNVNIDVDYNINSGQEVDQNELKSTYVLPKFNLKYNLNEKHTLRFGASKTYTLPQSKEISPYLYIGLSSSRVGNPDLIPSNNYNADVKWDNYLSSSELLTITSFFKYIQNPIASIYQGSAGGYYTYANISDKAIVAGAELEIRKNIFNQSTSNTGKINKLTTGLNASYIYSTTDVLDRTSNTVKTTSLEGAAPILANFDVSYNYSIKERSFTNSLVLSYFSDRLYSIGMAGFENVIEKSVFKLNFVSVTELNKHISIKLKANNLLNPQHILMRNDSFGRGHVLNSYYKGMDVSLGISYKF